MTPMFKLRLRPAGAAVHLFFPMLAGLVVAALTAAPAGAGGPTTIPAAWQGVWSTTTIERECGNPAIVNQETQLDTLCAGRPIFEGTDPGATCSGTVTDTAIDYSCSSTLVIFEGCTATLTTEIHGTRNGASTQAVLTISTTYSLGCEGLFPDSCTEYTSTGTRTANDPHCGQVAAISASWSSMKAQFR